MVRPVCMILAPVCVLKENHYLCLVIPKENFMMRLRVWFIFSVLLLLCGSCGNRKRQEEQKPLLTVSIEPLRYFAEAVGGDRFRVVSMVPEGSSPETYDPTPQQLMALNQSLAFLRIGYIGYERVWADKLQQNSPQLKFFDMSEGIELIREHDEAHHGHAHADGVEPHVWNSVANAYVIADNVYRSLCDIAPSEREYFKTRLDSLKQVIHRTDEAVKAYLADGQETFLIYHPALSYFAREYGLHQISIEKGGKEPLPAYLQELIGLCTRERVKTIFIQKEFDTRNAELIARELGVEVVPIHPLSYDWMGEMLHTAQALSKK